MTRISDHIRLSKKTIPPSFEGCWDGNFTSRTRAVDWQDFLKSVVPCIFLNYIEEDTAKHALTSLVSGCNRSMAREISTQDLVAIRRLFLEWHSYLTTQIGLETLTERVFTSNTHYLRHIPDMIERMGPLRSLSCKASKRSIKLHINSIRTGSRPGQNANNILVQRGVMSSAGIIEALAEDENHGTYAPDSWMVNPNGDPNSPQLWKPFGHYVGLDSVALCDGVDGMVISVALRSYDRRLHGNTITELENEEVQLAERAWANSSVYSSCMHRTRKH
ncbi:hypothetical protein G6F56_007965 [Rhizopus delemar]|nr:hypothetical protein G6F56_007965 [Rhizopus delemar]